MTIACSEGQDLVIDNIVKVTLDMYGDCHNINSVAYTGSVKRIIGDPFRSSQTLTRVDIGDSVQSITDTFCFECPSLVSVKIGAQCTLSTYCFVGGNNNITFDISPSNTNVAWDISNRLLLSNSNKVVAFYPQNSKTYHFPDSVLSILAQSGRDDTKTEIIVIPSSVQSIEADPFLWIRNLKKVIACGPYVVSFSNNEFLASNTVGIWISAYPVTRRINVPKEITQFEWGIAHNRSEVILVFTTAEPITFNPQWAYNGTPPKVIVPCSSKSKWKVVIPGASLFEDCVYTKVKNTQMKLTLLFLNCPLFLE